MFQIVEEPTGGLTDGHGLTDMTSACTYFIQKNIRKKSGKVALLCPVLGLDHVSIRVRHRSTDRRTDR